MKRTLLLTFLAVVLLGRAAPAQQPPRLPPVDTSRVVGLRLTDGSELVGRVVAATDTSVVLVTPAGLQVNVPARSITGWRARAGRVEGGRFIRRDPNVSRLFFAPTARTIPQGEGYFGDYYLFFPTVAYGISSRFTMSVGMSIIPGVSLPDQVFFVAPKVGLIQKPSFDLAAGVMYVGAGLASGGGSGGIAYGVTTLGSEDHAFTVGLGWPFVVGEGGSKNPWLMLGGETRASNRVKLLGELWKFPGSSEMPGIFGMRFVGEKMGVDFGFMHVFGANMGAWPFIPWVDFVVHF